MKIALIGFGAMGQLVAAQARKAGDEIGTILTSEDALATFPDKLFGHDVAIDFSLADAVPLSVEACRRELQTRARCFSPGALPYA